MTLDIKYPLHVRFFMALSLLMYRAMALPLNVIAWLASKYDRLCWNVYWLGRPEEKKIADDIRALVHTLEGLGVQVAAAPEPLKDTPQVGKIFASGGHPGDGVLQ